MRLAKVESGHGLGSRLFLRAARLVSRGEPDDIVKTLSYRPRFFGQPMLAVTDRALRGPSEWSVGERELFAAYTSRLNQCPF